MASEHAPEVRIATVLIVDIAGTVALRTRIGDTEAERRIRALIDAIIELATARGGNFIKSYGDDVMAAFDGQAVDAAAETAMAAQRAAEVAGLQLYAGLHAGPVEFRTTMGHPDAVGLTVSVAARLHKLTEGVPGRVHLLESAVERLGDALRGRASLFATRELKGVGLSRIWTLEWREQPTLPATLLVAASSAPRIRSALLLRQGERELRASTDLSVVLGRGRDCPLRLDDPELRISSMHVLIEHVDERWFVKDISRNGTWLHDDVTDAGCQLPQSIRVELPQQGCLSLGRPFADDPDGRYRVAFTQADAPPPA